jgi:hypothetical protein
VAARNLANQEILVARSTDGGQVWGTYLLPRPDTTYADFFPEVATTHDSFSDARVWITYDEDFFYYSAEHWRAKYVYSIDAGSTWSANHFLESPTETEMWTCINCAGYGSRNIRVVYIYDSTYNVIHYRDGNGTNPEHWRAVTTISNRGVSNAVPPLVANCGVTGNTLNTGLVFYTEPGPMNVWCNTYPFVGLAEDVASPPEVGLRAGIRRGLLDVSFSLAAPGRVGLAVYGVDGRRVWDRDVGQMSAGKHEVRFSVPELSSGTYFVLLQTRTGSINSRLVYCR